MTTNASRRRSRDGKLDKDRGIREFVVGSRRKDSHRVCLALPSLIARSANDDTVWRFSSWRCMLRATIGNLFRKQVRRLQTLELALVTRSALPRSVPQRTRQGRGTLESICNSERIRLCRSFAGALCLFLTATLLDVDSLRQHFPRAAMSIRRKFAIRRGRLGLPHGG